MKCSYCKTKATHKFIWADGRAYVPICGDHEAKARKEINKNGEWAEIIGARKMESKAEQLITQIVEGTGLPGRKRKFGSTTPVDQLPRDVAKASREMTRNPKKYGLKLTKEGDLVTIDTGEVIYIDGEGWNGNSIKWYLKYREW